MEDKLRDFLLQRNAVSNEILQRMETEKIDIEAIMCMTQEDLKEYLPAIGDRLAVVNFCRRQSSTNKCTNRTLCLLEKLKRGRELPKVTNHKKVKIDGCIRSPGRKPLPTRKIQLGWIFNGVLVRQKKGGGRREVTVDKSARKEDVLKIALNLFFPEEKSVQGNLENFDYDLLDFQHCKVDSKLTVGEIYDITKINLLRFYLVTNEKKTIIKPKEKSKEKDENQTIKNTVLHGDVMLSEVLKSAEIANEHSNYNDETLTITTFIGEQSSSTATPLSPLIRNSSPQDEMSFSFLEDIPSYEIDDDITETTAKTVLLKLHRGQVFEELLNAFQQDIYPVDYLKIEMVLPNGETEIADDLGGVLRDAITEFWSTFYEKCTVGTTLKVPFLRHDFREQQWTAIAKILVRGYSNEKYFPIKLAPSFVQSCFGKPVAQDNLLEDFKKYVSESESDIINETLTNFDADNDEIIDFFTRFESKWLPKEDNVKQLLHDIAHKELIQKPAFVAKCFGNQFINCKILENLDLTEIYKKLKPSAKNCLNQIVLDNPDLDDIKQETYEYLKKYVRECDDKLRSLFLRFCTGSDLPINQIKIAFETTMSSEFKRTPVAHTCSRVLVLPLGYDNYIDFRNEFNNILNSNIWVMDIV